MSNTFKLSNFSRGGDKFSRRDSPLCAPPLVTGLVCRRLQVNQDHRVDFHKPEVIGSHNSRWLQILETLLIQEHKPELNVNIPSIPLCIFNWSQSFMPHPWRHTSSPAARIHYPAESVTTYDSRHHVTTETALRVFHFSQRFSPEWP